MRTAAAKAGHPVPLKSLVGFEVRKRISFAPFYTRMISLPRQARDEHRKSTQKETCFLTAGVSGEGRGCELQLRAETNAVF